MEMGECTDQVWNKNHPSLGGVAFVAAGVLLTVIHGVMVWNKLSTIKKDFLKLDGVGPIDNRPSTWHMTWDMWHTG